MSTADGAIGKVFRLTLGDLKEMPWHLAVNVVAASKFIPRLLRFAIYRACGIQTRTRNILTGAFFNGPGVVIGKATFCNHRCYFENKASIRIGDECAIGPEVMFCTSTHELGPSSRRAGEVTPKPIVIGDGCWIGARAVILPGVTVGRGCVIAAGAVVAKGCLPNGLYAGVPARRIKDLL